MKPIVLIPARMASTRLPDKPMAMIGDAPMIVHVWRRAMEAKVGEVAVACDNEDIANAIRAEGGTAILTGAALPSGSDRIFQALGKLDPEKKHDIVINLQGDMPTLDPKLLKAVLRVMENPAVDIGTLAAGITSEQERNDPSVVKVVVSDQSSEFSGKAISFSRRLSDKKSYHHIGIYAYRRAALERFVSLPQSASEKHEKLEQLRAMDDGMRIGVAVVDTMPLGVDTPQQLEEARKRMTGNQR